jgi:hypothetical protein
VTGSSQYHIYQEYPEGGWSEGKRLAGLEPHPQDEETLSDESPRITVGKLPVVAVRIAALPDLG